MKIGVAAGLPICYAPAVSQNWVRMRRIALNHTACSLPVAGSGVPVGRAARSRSGLVDGLAEAFQRRQRASWSRSSPEKAEAKLAEAVKTCPTDCDARRYYAETLWLRNARPEAVAQLEEACRLSPDSDLRVRLAEMYLEMGQLDEAEQNVDQVLSRNLKLAAAWRVRGRVLRCDGRSPSGRRRPRSGPGGLLPGPGRSPSGCRV